MEGVSLYELNALVKRGIRQCVPGEYWVQAETSDVRANANGHCYLEFVQKDPRGNHLIAKARGTIWSNVYRMLAPYFEQATGQSFVSGIKVLVKVTVEFHELYGYNLNVIDIDPTYTLGDLARRRREILQQLAAEGVLMLNKELPMPVLPQRVAVISSATAAGYGDFSHQLSHNSQHYFFYTELFPAVMQGEQVEASILDALERIMQRLDEFDVIVIIRGGGASSDLSGFDTYMLAAACAQFPLPIITGIGHERDDTLIDSVAHARVKTPTAAAEYLIARVGEAADRLYVLSEQLRQSALGLIATESRRIEQLRDRIPFLSMDRISDARATLRILESHLRQSSAAQLTSKRHQLQLLSQRVADADPDKMLRKGYSIVYKAGKVLKGVEDVQPDDRLTVKLYNGEVLVDVREKKQSKKRKEI